MGQYTRTLCVQSNLSRLLSNLVFYISSYIVSKWTCLTRSTAYLSTYSKCPPLFTLSGQQGATRLIRDLLMCNLSPIEMEGDILIVTVPNAVDVHSLLCRVQIIGCKFINLP